MDSRIVLLTVVLAASAAGAGIRLEVSSDPALPAPNLIDGKNPDGTVGPKFFDATVKGKANCYSTFKPKTFKTGVRYVASCRIKPDKDVLSLKSNSSGLGFSMSFVQPGWKLTTMHARGGYPMPDAWNTVYSDPATMPTNTTDWFREIGFRYNDKGTGWVDDLRVTVADATLSVRVAGTRPLRQVKVVNAAGETMFDSGVLAGDAKTFEKSLVVNAAGIYTAMAVDDEGDVAAVTYPEPPKTNPGKEARDDRNADLFVPTGRPPEDAWRDLCRMPDGEIRHYGWDTSETPVARVYESSRDGGRTWTRKRAAHVREGAMVKCPWADYWLTLDAVNWREVAGGREKFRPFVAKSRLGPGDPQTVFRDVDLPGYGHWNRQVVPLASRKRWLCSSNASAKDAKGVARHAPAVAISDDDGETWRLSVVSNIVSRGRIVPPDNILRWENGCCEPTLLERRDGSVLMVVRTTMGRHYRYLSKDGGETWGTPEPMPGIYASNTSPCLHRLRDGRVLLLWNNTQPLPTDRKENHPEYDDWTLSGRGESAFTNRDVLHAAVSEDDGETWKGFREIRINDVANRADFRQYGNDTKDSVDKSVHQTQAVELEDGTLVVADGQSPLVRVLGRLDLASLCATNRFEDFRHGLVNVTTHLYVKSYCGETRFHGHCSWNRTNGALLVVDPLDWRTKREVLQVCRIADPRLYDDRQGVVWNFPAARKGRLAVECYVAESGVQATLTDHWYNACDGQAAKESPLAFALDRTLTGTARKWSKVAVDWDLDAKTATVSVDGKPAKTLALDAAPDFAPFGLSYLHLRTLAETTDPKGTYFTSFSMTETRR